ncbi:hypothetical protein DFJ74DRAFT_247947 [Hyaloraphidium curvatum]|nr:hypothetical protein DFJ74DRAFT_247947 [Hyaloraphidium curvatum]
MASFVEQLLSGLDPDSLMTIWALFASLASVGPSAAPPDRPLIPPPQWAIAIEFASRWQFLDASADPPTAAGKKALRRQALLCLGIVAAFALSGALHSGATFLQFRSVDSEKIAAWGIDLPAWAGGRRLNPVGIHRLTYNLSVTALHVLLIFWYHARRSALAEAAAAKPAEAGDAAPATGAGIPSPFPDLLSLVSLLILAVRLAYLCLPLPPPPGIRTPLPLFRVLTDLPVLWAGMLNVGRLLGEPGGDKPFRAAAIGTALACFFTLPALLLPPFPDKARDPEAARQVAFFEAATHAMYLYVMWNVCLGTLSKAGELRDAEGEQPGGTGGAAGPASRAERRAKEREDEKKQKKKAAKAE